MFVYELSGCGFESSCSHLYSMFWVTSSNKSKHQIKQQFHIPCHIPLAHDEVEPEATVVNETVNSENESNDSEDSDAAWPCGLFLSLDFSDSDEELKLMKRQSFIWSF